IVFDALPGARAMILEIVGSAIARPPVLQVSRWRDTRLAFACAAGIDDCLDFRLGKRATEDFYFVDLSLPEVPIGWTCDRNRSNPVLTIRSCESACCVVGSRSH